MPPRLHHDKYFDRVLAKDPTCNGHWFFAVRTTGIYCLPSCSSRPPKKENTVFFKSTHEAREEGFRPCKKCHPDDFATGLDPVLQTLQTLVDELRARPEEISGVPALVKRSGYGSSRLFELLRQHYHTTPASLIERARLDKASRLLRSTNLGLVDLSEECGFGALSSFHAAFRRWQGLTPTEYRDLPGTGKFTVSLPSDFRYDILRRFLERDPESVLQRLTGDTLTAALRIGNKARLAHFRFSDECIHISTTPETSGAAHDFAVRLTGLRQDAAAFTRLASDLHLQRLVAKTKGLRIPQEASAYSALLWAVLGQQINVAFACTLRRRLIELASPFSEDGLYVHPTPSEVASVSQEALLKNQFSRQKADYARSLSQTLAAAPEKLEALSEGSATAAERSLLSLRGLGPWSVNYVLMRGLGFLDCVPYGDTGITSGLQALFKREERPDVDETRRLMAPFAPLRSLATAHLWQYQRS